MRAPGGRRRADATVTQDDQAFDPAEELAALLAATRAHLRRRRALGLERVFVPGAARSATPVVPAAPAAQPPVRPFTPPPPSVPPPTTPGASPVRPPPPPSLPRGTASAPTELRLPPPPSAPAVEGAAAVRARAAACADLASLRNAVAACRACELCERRTQTVFADGPARARVMFVGEAPGEHEDRQGVPFVGAAGQLLTDIIEKGMGLPRSEVYIANVVKCRPPGNRDPSDLEKRTCTPWLERQIELVAPEVLVALGRHASNFLLGLEGPAARSMGSLRGRVHERGGRKIVPTFHPSYLLRTPEDKKECWKDIQLAMGLLGIKPRAKG